MARLPQVSLSDDYDLMQAFHLIGERLYGDAWAWPNVLQARRPDIYPEKVSEKRAALDETIRNCEVGIDAIFKAIAKTIDAAKIEQFEAAQSELNQQQSDAYLERTLLPDVDSAKWSEQNYAKRLAVEAALIGALANRNLTWWSWPGSYQDDRVWQGVTGFKYVIELSCIWFPRKISRLRRQFVRLHKLEFDRWLDQTYPPAEGIRSPGECAEAWFLNEIKLPKRMIREDYIKEMASEFGISWVAAGHIWTLHAPGHWKKSGRPKKSK